MYFISPSTDLRSNKLERAIFQSSVPFHFHHDVLTSKPTVAEVCCMEMVGPLQSHCKNANVKYVGDKNKSKRQHGTAYHNQEMVQNGQRHYHELVKAVIGGNNNSWPSSLTNGKQKIQPTYLVEDTETEFSVGMDVPGIKPTDIKVTVEGNDTLCVSGSRTMNRTSKDKSGGYSKQSYSASFVEKFHLPSNVELEKLQANIANGVLTVTAPKQLVDTTMTTPSIRTIDVGTKDDIGNDAEAEQESNHSNINKSHDSNNKTTDSMVLQKMNDISASTLADSCENIKVTTVQDGEDDE